ncbi:unnamed protein product, partial [marine sediment metagenome]
KPYFFIPHILDSTARILGIIPREEILWNIYQMLRHNIILSKDLQFQRYELDIIRQEKREREYEIRKILEKKELAEILNESISISIEEAHQKMKFYLKKAELAKKNSAYQEALNEYEKALVYAKIYNAGAEIGKISFQILEILRFNKEIELEFAREQSIKAEKKKNYIKTLKYLFEIKDILTSEIKAMMGGKGQEKCQICHSIKNPLNGADFFASGRYCPSCGRPYHLHCAALWAKKSE